MCEISLILLLNFAQSFMLMHCCNHWSPISQLGQSCMLV